MIMDIIYCLIGAGLVITSVTNIMALWFPVPPFLKWLPDKPGKIKRKPAFEVAMNIGWLAIGMISVVLASSALLRSLG
jgi:hypothetical protein